MDELGTALILDGAAKLVGPALSSVGDVLGGFKTIQKINAAIADTRGALRITPKVGSPSTLDPRSIRFMQNSIKNATDEHTVLGNAEKLYTKAMRPTQLPAIRVWQDAENRIWTLDHRRLAAFRMAGTDQIPVRWAGQNLVEANMWKMTTKTEGLSIRLKFGDGSFFTVE